MSLLRALARRHAWLAALLLVIAMGARGAVPAGYMPGVQASGAFGLVPCDGTVAPAPPDSMDAMAGMPHHAHSGSHDQHRHADQPCAFAGLIAPLLPHNTLAEAAPRMAEADGFGVAPGLALHLRTTNPRPPSRGPPLPA